jgi:hypothetical protein
MNIPNDLETFSKQAGTSFGPVQLVAAIQGINHPVAAWMSRIERRRGRVKAYFEDVEEDE